MNRCLRCHTAISAKNARCPACGWEFSPTAPDIYGDTLTKDVSGFAELCRLVIHPVSLLMLILPTFDVWSADPLLHRCFPGLGFFIATIYVYWLYGLSEMYQLEPDGRTAMACVIAGFYPYVVVVIPATITAKLACPERFSDYLIAQLSIAIAYFGIVVVLRGFLVREHLLTIRRRERPLETWNSVPWADHVIRELTAGRAASLRYRGNAMTGMIEDGQLVHLQPISGDLQVGDPVLAMVSGQVYIHVVTDLHDHRVQIGTHHRRIVGWTPRGRVFGKVVAVSP